MHRDAGRHTGVDRPRRTELGDRYGHRRDVPGRGGQARPLLPEEQHAPPRQDGGLEGDGAGRVVHPDHRQVGRRREVEQPGHVGVVSQVLVAVGDHRSSPVPPTAADDVHLGGEERVRRPHDRPDVEVVAEVLDRHVEGVPAPVEVGDDRLDGPVAVAVDHVAPVAVGQQLRIEPRVLRPRAGPGPDADRRPPVGGAAQILIGHPEWIVARAVGQPVETTAVRGGERQRPPVEAEHEVGPPAAGRRVPRSGDDAPGLLGEPPHRQGPDALQERGPPVRRD